MEYIISCKGYDWEKGKVKKEKTYFTEVGKLTTYRKESGKFYNVNDAILACNILNELADNEDVSDYHYYIVEGESGKQYF